MKTVKKNGLFKMVNELKFKLVLAVSFTIGFISLTNSVHAQEQIVPPFTQESAIAKLKINESAWNTRDPEKIAMLYAPNASWRDGTTFLTGRLAIISYLKEKFAHQADYKIAKEVWGAKLSKNAIRYEEEWRDPKTGKWYHGYGVEVVLFDDNGLITERFASVDAKEITAAERSLN